MKSPKRSKVSSGIDAQVIAGAARAAALDEPFEGGHRALQEALAALSPSALRLTEDESGRPVQAPLSPEEHFARLALTLPEEGRPLSEVLDMVEKVLAGAPKTSGGAFFNQLFGGRDPAATFADMLSTLMNHSLYTYKLAGPLVLIEAQLLCSMAERVGYREAGGLFCPGGSLSNLVAMLCARDRIAPSAKERGVPPGLRVYCSSESHYSLQKAINIIGLGRENLVSISVDHQGAMCPELLQSSISDDLAAGLRPMMVCGTAGTTVRGAFDPFKAIAEIAEKFGIWFHIDGAFGGSALWLPELAPKLAGVDRADSFTWDAHKAMGVPLTCSVLLTRERVAVSRALSEGAHYLFQEDDDSLNPGLSSLQCGRRNDALKLWAAWQLRGAVGWRARIERQRALALALAEEVSASATLELSEAPHFLNVCFEYPGRSSADICARLQREQRALVGYGTVRGREVIRAAVINPQLTRADLKQLIQDIITIAPHCAVSRV